jgi:hypothetical protein
MAMTLYPPSPHPPPQVKSVLPPSERIDFRFLYAALFFSSCQLLKRVSFQLQDEYQPAH